MIALHQSERPWIKLELVKNQLGVTVNVFVGQKPTAGKIVNAFVDSRLVNIGKSPALEEHVVARIAANDVYDIAKQRKAACKEAESWRKADLGLKLGLSTGHSIFPGDSQSETFNAGRDVSDLVDPWSHEAQGLLVGCVVYSDQFNLVHHTSFCFEFILPNIPIGKGVAQTVMGCLQNYGPVD